MPNEFQNGSVESIWKKKCRRNKKQPETNPKGIAKEISIETVSEISKEISQSICKGQYLFRKDLLR